MIKLIIGDITKLNVEAIVNAANKTLLGGGGVDGAIHRAAGKKLLNECSKLNGCETGECKITKGYDLPAKFIAHTAGPVWRGGKSGEAEQLTLCYENSLNALLSLNVKSAAFPCISCGIYGYPTELAAEIAIKTAVDFLNDNNSDMEIIFCCFSKKDHDIYENILTRKFPEKFEY